MVPVRLELKNFMSYGENVMPIDFTGMHVACLSGDNGNGKSALLDAITWALWGQARSGTDDLIRIGSSDMSVRFDFELGGNIYRVIKAASRKRGSSSWELQMADGDGGFRPITGQGVRDTGKQIEKLLRMDHRTFINSAYIQQGKADEFTRQTVGDRKKVLADILDLSRYDTLSKKAKDLRDAADAKIENLRQRIASIDAELIAEEAVRSSIEAVQVEIAELHRTLKVQENALRTLERRKAELESEQDHALEVKRELASTESEIQALEERLGSARERLSADEVVISRKDEIDGGYAALQDVLRLGEEMEEVRNRAEILQAEKTALERLVTMERHNIDLKLKMAEGELVETLSRIEEKGYLEGEIASLKSQVMELVPAGAHMVTRDACNIERRMAQAEQMLFLVKESEKLLPSIQHRVEELRHEAGNGKSSGDAQNLAMIERQIVELGYDPQEHTRIKSEEVELRRWERLKLELEQAENRLPDDLEDARMLEELIAAKRRLIEKDDTELVRASERLEEMPEIEQQLAEASDEVGRLRARETELTSALAVHRHQLAVYDEMKEQKAGLLAALSAAETDLSAYTELTKAFGRVGVQSLIIENAVPEIQEEANNILSRMTDGTMRIRLDTMRETKTSGAVETLDIRVQDDVGDRAYEMLSGGEAFRVNFALRIALSELLARRAGARLETLIIDEGFGTQDGKGREKLIEAIDAVKDDFKRILVITHIEELKDAFPTRIEVYKDRDGSQVMIT